MSNDAEALLGRFAEARSGVFTRADARAAGVAYSTITARVRGGLWVPEFGSALRAATTPLTPIGRDWAALARIGPGAALSHLSAARLWDLDQRVPADVWLTVPPQRGPSSTREYACFAVDIFRQTPSSRFVAYLSSHQLAP